MHCKQAESKTASAFMFQDYNTQQVLKKQPGIACLQTHFLIVSAYSGAKNVLNRLHPTDLACICCPATPELSESPVFLYLNLPFMIKEAFHGFLTFNVCLDLYKNHTAHTLGCKIWQNILTLA